MEQGKIVKISGPLVVARGVPRTRMFDVVRVGKERLIGEILEIRADLSSIQVYEETGGLQPGEPVESLYQPLSVELGPGILGTIYDGIQRPLDAIKAKTGNFVTRGIEADSIDKKHEWEFVPQVEEGDTVEPGDILGTVQETEIIEHRVLVPLGIHGKVQHIHSGTATVEDTIAVITGEGEQKHEVAMLQRWPVRRMRPYARQLESEEPLLTGQRVIDTFFPIAKGGTACIPGPFGSGKTVVQHQLAKWANAQVIVFVGCGERGNEMTDVLNEFPELKDPQTGKPLMQRTILIANTSNMPVAAREASIYTGITLAEYYRDMGYDVALMADSTSRWAEALREMSGRLEEMPGEEGYPAYLPSRLAEFYERAGRVVTLGKEKRIASLSAIGAVSPPGGDLSEPVTQATLRIVRVFWALVAELAYQRHFPAIHWLRSYSLYLDSLEEYFNREVSPDWSKLREQAIALLQREDELQETVRLVGMDVLSAPDRIAMETARSLREDFLQQFAFHEVDTYSPLEKQYLLLKLVLDYDQLCLRALEAGVSLERLLETKARGDIAQAKYFPNETAAEEIGKLREQLRQEIEDLQTPQQPQEEEESGSSEAGEESETRPTAEPVSTASTQSRANSGSAGASEKAEPEGGG